MQILKEAYIRHIIRIIYKKNILWDLSFWIRFLDSGESDKVLLIILLFSRVSHYPPGMNKQCLWLNPHISCCTYGCKFQYCWIWFWANMIICAYRLCLMLTSVTQIVIKLVPCSVLNMGECTGNIPHLGVFVSSTETPRGVWILLIS